MKSLKIFLFIVFIQISGTVFSQTMVSGKVFDSKEKKPVEYAVVAIPDQDLWAVTNEKGEFLIRSVRPGKVVLTISCLGFEKQVIEYGSVSDIPQNTIFYIKEDNLALNEVVVTAQKKKNELATTYLIDRNSLNHIQSTSVGDVLSQLPGGQTSRTVTLTSGAQRLAVRSQSSSELDNPSFGTAIVVDGIRLSNNGAFTDGVSGTDTRNIGIHNIESIEVTTGLPSVEHGDLSAGLISINTKKGKTPLELEFIRKPNISSYSVSKGFSFGKTGGTLNASLDYTRSISDRTSPYTTYSRNNFSMEYRNFFGSKQHPLIFTYIFSANAGGYNSKADPDAFRDTYQKTRDNTLRNSVKMNWLINAPWITSLEFVASMNYSDKKDEIKINQSSSSAQPAIHTTEKGYFVATGYDVNPKANVLLLPTGYWYQIGYDDEKPVDYSTELKAKWSRSFGQFRSNFLLGVQYHSTGNYGKGVSYDDMRYAPTYREFRYDKQPFVNNLAFYAEEKIGVPLFQRDLQIQAGVRSDMTVIKGSEYGAVSGFSPRVNAQYTVIEDKTKLLEKLSFHAGWGDAVKLPSSFVLFSVPAYADKLAFASTSNSENVGYYAYYTIPQKAIYNPDLKWQRSRKFEFGTEVKFKGVHVSVSAYIDRTLNPYRSSTVYTPYSYNLTTQSDLSGCTIPETNRIYTIDQNTGIVSVFDKVTGSSQQLTYSTYKTVKSNNYFGNGTPVVKKGLEWIVDFGEIPALKTRIRVDGAYASYKGFDQTITPSLGSSGNMANGNPYAYIGYYVGGANSANGSETKKLTLNVMFTTHIPVLRLIFSLRAEGCLYDYSQYLSSYSDGSRSFVLDSKDGYSPSGTKSDIYAGDQYIGLYPLYYVSIDDMNTKIPFAEKFAWAKDHDQTLYNELAKMVVKSNYNYTFNSNTYSPYFSANINLTKEIGDKISVSFQANNFFNNTMQVKSTWAGNNISLYKSSKITPLYYGFSLRIKI